MRIDVFCMPRDNRLPAQKAPVLVSHTNGASYYTARGLRTSIVVYRASSGGLLKIQWKFLIDEIMDMQEVLWGARGGAVD